MDILSFILGMSVVVVIALAIVAVMAFVKVNRTNKEITNLHLNIDEVHRNLDERANQIYSDMNDKTGEILRIIDSRFDKLDTKINLQILKK